MKSDPRWISNPSDHASALKALEGRTCPVCGSNLLRAIIHPTARVWDAHCNNCGSKIPVVVILNREEWIRSASLPAPVIALTPHAIGPLPPHDMAAVMEANRRAALSGDTKTLESFTRFGITLEELKTLSAEVLADRTTESFLKPKRLKSA